MQPENQKGLSWLDRFGGAARTGSINEKGGAYYNYATLCLDLGDLQVAAMNAQKALQQATLAQNQYIEGYCYLLLGDISKSSSHEEALTQYQRACALFHQVQNPRGEAYGIAAYLRVSPLGDGSAVSLQRLQELELPANAQAEVAECLGLLRLSEQHPREAAQHLSSAAALYQTRSEPDRRWRILA